MATKNEELRVISTISRALEKLDLSARRRVIDLFDGQIADEEKRRAANGPTGEQLSDRA